MLSTSAKMEARFLTSEKGITIMGREKTRINAVVPG